MKFERQRIIYEQSHGSHVAVYGQHSAGGCKKWSEIAAVIIGAMGSETLGKLLEKID